MNYPDIFFIPEYLDLIANTGFGGEAFSYNDGSYNFYARNIPDTDYFDIVSPYGYSGALGIDMDAFHKYCLQSNIIAEFARLHPFLENHNGLEAEQAGEVYYIDLTRSEQDIWKGIDKGCRSSIKKAQQSNLTILHGGMALFKILYDKTMDRNQAASEYYFDNTFFRKLERIGDCWLAILEGKTIAGIVTLGYGNYCHYFLAGSDTDYRRYNPSNLLLYQIIMQSKSSGYKIFNLGGARDSNHATFKRSFSHVSKPFYVYKKVHNQEVYNQICWSKGIDPQDTGYFPAYRRRNDNHQQ